MRPRPTMTPNGSTRRTCSGGAYQTLFGSVQPTDVALDSQATAPNPRYCVTPTPPHPAHSSTGTASPAGAPTRPRTPTPRPRLPPPPPRAVQPPNHTSAFADGALPVSTHELDLSSAIPKPNPQRRTLGPNHATMNPHQRTKR